MSTRVARTFRLLDSRVGWDAAPEGGFGDVVLVDGVLTLCPGGPVQEDPQRVSPPLLARGQGCCTWWLIAEGALLRLDECQDGFLPWNVPTGLGAPTAVSARGRHLAVLAGDRVLVLDEPMGRVVGEAVVPGASALSLTPGGRVMVGDDRGRLCELDLSGLQCAVIETPGCRPVRAIVHDDDPECTAIVLHVGGTVSIVAGGTVSWADPAVLASLPDSQVLAATERGFCLRDRGCFGWDGRPLRPDDLGQAMTQYAVRGQFLTARLDSGIPRCRWHRVRVDADVPTGTSLAVALATTDDSADRPSRPPEPGPWAAFPAGPPHPSDWYDAGPGVTDFLVRTPPGRYAFVRLRMEGSGHASPAVHQIRIDFPRVTSLDSLPAAYAEDPNAADFTERFLSLFDAELEVADEALRRRAQLLDPEALPDDALPWLASFLGVGFEAAMSPAQRRSLLALAPDLFRERGTPGGLVDTLRAALGIQAAVEELGPQRPWGALGRGARLGAVRLFGRSTARVRLGTTVLGTAPINARGNPDDDARLSGAHRFRVHVAATSTVDRDLVRRVVRSQSPAFTESSVRFGSDGFWLGAPRVGIDTSLLPPGPAVLNTVRLGHAGVLRSGRRGRTALVGTPLLLDGATGTE